MEKNKTGKYFKYAIGEIVLVVIGILIALSINNWNEDNKDRKAETQTFINLKTEFKENHNRLLHLIRIRKRNEDECRTYIEMITNDTVPFLKKIRTKPPNISSRLWNANYPILNSLLASGDIKKIQNDSLKIMLMNWSSQIESFSEFDNRALDGIKRRQNYLDENIYGAIVKPGTHEINTWPGSYYPNNISDKLDAQMTSIINDITYYNHSKQMILQSYELITYGTNVAKNSEKIMSKIDFELKKRTK